MIMKRRGISQEQLDEEAKDVINREALYSGEISASRNEGDSTFAENQLLGRTGDDDSFDYEGETRPERRPKKGKHSKVQAMIPISQNNKDPVNFSSGGSSPRLIHATPAHIPRL